MKILNLKIYNENEDLIRDIDFTKNDISFVYGNVLKPKNLQETSNSIGKTLTLKMCDYIFGCKVDKSMVDKKLGDYRLSAQIEHNNEKHKVIRSIDGKVFLLDDEEIDLTRYKSIFGIDRNEISRQILLSSKGSLIGYNKNPVQDDYITYISMLGLKNLSKDVEEYYDVREKIKNLEDSKNELLNILNLQTSKIEEEIYINEKNITDLKEILKKVNKDIEKIKTSEEDAKLQKEYEYLSSSSKKIQNEISKMDVELEYLRKYIEVNNQNDSLTFNDVKKIYSAAKFEIPEMVVKKIEEVEAFYKNVIEDRIINMSNRINEINVIINLKKTERENIIKKMDHVGLILSNNEIYKKAVSILNEYNNKYNEEKFKQGKLYQVKNMLDSINVAKKEQIKKFNEITDNINLSQPMINTFKDYVFEIVKKIYNDKATAYFDISNGNFRTNGKALNVDLRIQGEGGEGVMEVKKNIMDILLFKYNTKYDVLILDSSCFNGIDTRQIQGLLSTIESVCKEENKQAIISINKYQLTDEFVKIVEENRAIELSEDDKLLGFDF